jgi:hypothetical protein
MTKLVRQITPSDCAVAVVAMALNKTHTEVKNALPEGYWDDIVSRGTSDEMMKEIFATHGLIDKRDYVWRRFSIEWGSLYFIRNILWGRRAIISVRSKNIKEGWHYVYFDGQRLFDPSTKRQYTEMSEVEPNVIWLFNENLKLNHPMPEDNEERDSV